MSLLVKALNDDEDFDLQLRLLAGESGLDREIRDPRVQKSGLAIAGFVDFVHVGRVQVLGGAEIAYLESLDTHQRVEAVGKLMQLEIPCIVVTKPTSVPTELAEGAERARRPLFESELPSTRFVTHAQDFLDDRLSPEISTHGVLLDVFGVGVLLIGASGIGKSECALDLILRGHRLVGDDAVVLKKRRRQLIGMASPLTRHHMEVRGLGILSVKDLFGAASVRERQVVDLVVELLDWHPNLATDRTGLDELHEEILDVQVAKVSVPIRPGRNLASIVEVAARNHLLRERGHHAARDLNEKIERQLSSTRQPLEGE
jgi:HPr kinase/phosphorylase